MAIPSIITLTDAAIARIKQLVSMRRQDKAVPVQTERGCVGEGDRPDTPVTPATREAAAVIDAIRISVTTRGCSGLKYKIEYADRAHPGDITVAQGGVTVLVDPKALMFVIGSRMDFVESDLRSGFTFINPNEKGRCGCGESFHV